MGQSRQKLDIFRVQSQFLGANINSIFLKIVFFSEYQIWRRTFSISLILEKVYLVKMCPIFHSSPPVFGAKYQSLLRVCWYLHRVVSYFGYRTDISIHLDFAVSKLPSKNYMEVVCPSWGAWKYPGGKYFIVNYKI